MGYETKLYIVRPYNFRWEEKTFKNGNMKPVGGSVLAMIDICKAGYYDPVGLMIQREVKNEKNQLAYLYHSNGNTKMLTDRYGDKLRFVDIGVVLEAFEKELGENKGTYHYARYDIALAVLKEVVKHYGTEDKIKCILYGY